MFNYNNSSIHSLLNADELNFRTQHFRVSELISMIEFKKLDIFENDRILRRYLNVWTINEKSLFIESLILGFPIPLFYLDGSEQPWKIIDGVNRIFAINDFIHDKFKLQNLEYLEEGENENFTSLPNYLRFRIFDAEVVANVVNPGTSKYVRYNIFKRLNSTSQNGVFSLGLNRNNIKIRNIFFQEEIIQFIDELSNNILFLSVTSSGSIKSEDEIMKREFITYFIGFNHFNYRTLPKHIETFLSHQLIDLSFKSNYGYIYHQFNLAIERLDKLLENHHWKFERKKRYLIPFASLINILSELNDNEFDRIKINRNYFINDYIDFLLSMTSNINLNKQDSIIYIFHETQKLIYKYILYDKQNSFEKF